MTTQVKSVMPKLLWPVTGNMAEAPGYIERQIAVFFDYRDARDFVDAELPTRNLYVGEPQYV